jgi:hypothetical protein
MIASPTVPSPAAIPHPFALNDLRMHSSIAEEPSSTSALTLYGLVLAVVLAIGAFVWLDPLRLFTPTEATPPAPAFVPSAEPARLIERQEIIAPRTPVPATKSVEVPIAPVVQAPRVLAPVVLPRAASIKPETRGKPMDRTSPTVLQASPKGKLLTKPEEETALPALVTKPEERTDAPIVLKLGDDTKTAPKPAAANDQTPVTE